MKLGIIGAMENEVSQLVDRIENSMVYNKAGIKFICGDLNGTDVCIARSGVGKVNAAICTQLMISTFDCTHIINTGIAGSINKYLNIGDVVIGSYVMHHDVDATPFGYRVGQIPQMDHRRFYADKYLLHNIYNVLRKYEDLSDVRYYPGVVLSGDQFVSSSIKRSELSDGFFGDCVEMEGASIGQVCVLNNIPFSIIRSISDNADDRAASIDYDTFEQKAIDISVKVVLNLCKELGSKNER